ncbi:MAG TPA: IS1 family transposase [Opitutaceae bacterium]|nr:IS1 family transposase [Opitutaceae bacterium]
MAYILSTEKQTAAIAALCEGTSIRAIERMTGIHRDTIMRLGIRVGEACGRMHDERMRELNCTHIQADEVWGFVGKKQKSATLDEQNAGKGDVWTFVAFDPESKLVPSYLVGKRDFKHTYHFVSDLASRMRSRIHLSTDGMQEYRATIAEAFGSDVDYGQIVKVYGAPDGVDAARRYSPPRITSIRKMSIRGEPDHAEISTSLVERQNLTMRMHMRRLTRLTNAFSKKVENFRAAVSLHFAYYNFVKMHGTIRCTPALQAGVADRVWTVGDLLELA